MLYKVAVLCLLIYLTAAQYSGLRGRVNLSGLQTILSSVRFGATRRPDLFVNLGTFKSIDVREPLIRKYILQNVRAQSLSFTEQSDVEFSEFIFTNFTLTDVTLTGQWSEAIIVRGMTFKRAGNFEAKANNIKFIYGVILVPSKGKFLFDVTRCRVIANDLTVEFTKFNGSDQTKIVLENLLSLQISKRICASYMGTQERLVANLQPNPVMSLGGIADMDGSIEDIVIVDQGLVFNFTGRCYPPGQPETDYGYMAKPPPTFSDSEKSIQLVGDEYILQTFIASLHSQKLMGATITQKELPPMLAGMLTTDMISVAMDLPGLQRYGKRPMRVRIDSIAPPDVKFLSGGTVSMAGMMDIDFMVETENGNRENVMSMTAMVEGTNAMFAKGTRLYSNITGMDMEMLTVSSTVGEVGHLADKIDQMMKMMTPYVMKSLNELFSAGVEMPFLVSLKLVDLELDIKEGQMEMTGGVTLPFRA